MDKPYLIKKIFISEIYNIEGIYRLKFFKSGEWIEVTVDDYIPCYPKGGPIFSKNQDPNELWLSLLIKAFAKLHGGYYKLMNGNVKEALIDLTGFPTSELLLRDTAVYDMMKSDELWETITGYID